MSVYRNTKYLDSKLLYRKTLLFRALQLLHGRLHSARSACVLCVSVLIHLAVRENKPSQQPETLVVKVLAVAIGVYDYIYYLNIHLFLSSIMTTFGVRCCIKKTLCCAQMIL